MTLAIHQVLPAPPKTSVWLTALLTPAIEAARIQAPPAVELRPMGELGGLCRPLRHDPDARICLTHWCVLWPSQSLVILYLHETCHRILGPGDHDAAFDALLHCLLTRTHDAGVTDEAVLALGLYEFADTPSELVDAEPDGGVGRSMTWSISTSNKLSPSDISAEELAVEIRHRYNVWLDKLAQEPLLAARAQAAVAARIEAVSMLREKLFFRNVLVGGLSMLVLVIVGLMIKGAGS